MPNSKNCMQGVRKLNVNSWRGDRPAHNWLDYQDMTLVKKKLLVFEKVAKGYKNASNYNLTGVLDDRILAEL